MPNSGFLANDLLVGVWFFELSLNHRLPSESFALTYDVGRLRNNFVTSKIN